MNNEVFNEWLKTRPECIQKLAAKYPPVVYIMKEGAPYGMSCSGTKVHLYSYYEDGDVSIIVKAADKTEEGIAHEIFLCAKHAKNLDDVRNQDVRVKINPMWITPITT